MFFSTSRHLNRKNENESHWENFEYVKQNNEKIGFEITNPFSHVLVFYRDLRDWSTERLALDFFSVFEFQILESQ